MILLLISLLCSGIGFVLGLILDTAIGGNGFWSKCGLFIGGLIPYSIVLEKIYKQVKPIENTCKEEQTETP